MQDIIKEWGPAIITVIAIFLVIAILQNETVQTTVTGKFQELITQALTPNTAKDLNGTPTPN